MTLLRFMLMTLCGLFLGGQALAQAATTHIQPSLIAETDNPSAGSTVTLALAMKPNKGWHGYWKNPGDAGITPQFNWTLPNGVSAGVPQYPVPHRLILGGLMNYVYEADYAHLITIQLPKGVVAGTVLPITLAADWLACTDEICVPESGTLSTKLIVGDGKIDAARESQFDKWRALMPRPLGSDATFEVKNGTFRIAVPLPAAARTGDVYFFPETDGALEYAAPQTVRRDGDMLTIEVKAPNGADGLQAVEGVLAIDKNKGLELKAVPGPVTLSGAVINAADAAQTGGDAAGLLLGSVAAAFGAAFLGGLLLNIMPCVFPILSLKALSLARSGETERVARREALAYSAGIILVCVALGAVLLGLRASGAAVGWAFQLQDPRVILVLLLLVTAIALNLSGLFGLRSIGVGDDLARKGGVAGAFWTGALAAFIATPCTGPFMAAALGAALVMPPLAALSIFAGLGLGLATPFLALGFIPALRAKLPKPGPWMERFQRILAIPMFLTALGLAWILGRQAGVNGMTMGLGAALVLGLALWWLGRRQASGKTRLWLPLAPAAAVVMAAMVSITNAPLAASPTTESRALEAAVFSQEKLDGLRGEGKPVFVYFTADWCLSCKVNEKTSIERQDVADAFKAAGITTLVGDWTNGDATIGRFIESHGRTGVPLYLFYRPGSEPEILPQILTPDILKALAA